VLRRMVLRRRFRRSAACDPSLPLSSSASAFWVGFPTIRRPTRIWPAIVIRRRSGRGQRWGGFVEKSGRRLRAQRGDAVSRRICDGLDIRRRPDRAGAWIGGIPRQGRNQRHARRIARQPWRQAGPHRECGAGRAAQILQRRLGLRAHQFAARRGRSSRRSKWPSSHRRSRARKSRSQAPSISRKTEGSIPAFRLSLPRS
jgi:hypothetical protein